MKRLEGKVAVVTGGSSGRAGDREALQEEGARVAITGRSNQTPEKAVKWIGNGVLAIQADVANWGTSTGSIEGSRRNLGGSTCCL
jgi:NAD(P)-dependent dehydrogenase (short-subunit alcohol dehydrogenase family)